MFLLYGPNGTQDGENKARYANPVFDRSFEQMKNMDNGPRRQAIIDEMVKIARDDARRAVGPHMHDDARRERLPRHQVEATTVDINVAAALDDELVPGWRTRSGAQIGMRHQ